MIPNSKSGTSVQSVFESMGFEVYDAPISMSDINTLLGAPSSTQLISLNDEGVRFVAGKPSGTISMGDLSGKTNDWVDNGSEFLWKDDIPTSEKDTYTIGNHYDITNDGTFDYGNKYVRAVQYCEGEYCYDSWDLYAIPQKKVNL
jgi:hypothetical protein